MVNSIQEDFWHVNEITSPTTQVEIVCFSVCFISDVISCCDSSAFHSVHMILLACVDSNGKNRPLTNLSVVYFVVPCYLNWCITVHSILYVFYAVCVDMHTATCCHWIVSYAGIMLPSFPQALSLCKAPAAVFRHLDLSGGVGQFWGFSPRRNNVLQWWRWNLAWVLRAKFHHQSVQWWRWVPKNWKKFNQILQYKCLHWHILCTFFSKFSWIVGSFLLGHVEIWGGQGVPELWRF